MTDRQKVEFDKITLEIRDLKKERSRLSRKGSGSMLDWKKDFDLLQKMADLLHMRNHIQYSDLDNVCKCGYKSPK